MQPIDTSPLHKIYFDESGYTGSDLLNPDQPFFSVASVDVKEHEARSILQTSFPEYQGKEFKFTRLFRRPRHRLALVAFSEQLSQIANRAFIYSCDKKFAALVKAVDLLVEPLLHDRGWDFYANGFNRRYVNTFHFVLCRFGGTQVYDSIVRWYDRFSRNPNAIELHHIRQMADSFPREIASFIHMLVVGAEYSYESDDSISHTIDNEIQLACVLALVNHWRQRISGAIEIVHDASTNFFRQIEQWKKITSVDVDKATVKTEDGRRITFPLGVVSTQVGDSANSYSLQLCDMIAGLSNQLYRYSGRVESGWRREIIEAGWGELSVDGIRPGGEFVEGLPTKLDGPDFVDQFITAISNGGVPRS